MFSHPDRCNGVERNATRAIGTLVCAKEMVENKIKYLILMGYIDSEPDFVLSDTLVYTVLERSEEK